MDLFLLCEMFKCQTHHDTSGFFQILTGCNLLLFEQSYVSNVYSKKNS